MSASASGPPGLVIRRRPRPEDVPLLMGLIVELAEYERLAEHVSATDELMRGGAVRRAPGRRGADRRARRRARRLRALLPDLLDLPGDPGRVARGPVRPPLLPAPRRRQVAAGGGGRPHPRAGRGAAGMVGPGLERAGARLLPWPRRGPDGRMGHPPPGGETGRWRPRRRLRVAAASRPRARRVARAPVARRRSRPGPADRTSSPRSPMDKTTAS